MATDEGGLCTLCACAAIDWSICGARCASHPITVDVTSREVCPGCGCVPYEVAIARAEVSAHWRDLYDELYGERYGGA